MSRFKVRHENAGLSYDLRWLDVLSASLRHIPYCLVASRGAETVGMLPLALVKSVLFGRFLVSLPYVNESGLVSTDESVAAALIDGAVRLADELNVKFLELRHRSAIAHERLTATATDKVQMRLLLPETQDELWKQLKAKVRNQVRKAESYDLGVEWGRQALLPDFYRVFSRNMRDLGTPVYPRRMFREILEVFDGEAELCVVRKQRVPIAAALLLHGRGVTEVPSASSLRQYNSTNANMLMYWHLLCRTIDRSQHTFDFGRSSEGSGTMRFKKQWGAQPFATAWQYYLRHGEANQMRPNSGKFERVISLWKKLPVPVAQALGPFIVRGIP